MVENRAGSQFGPYRLVRLLGAGGFGEVYEAEDTAMHRVVALKLLSSTFSQNPVFRERLFREARTAGRLREPHVLPIHSCGEIDGQVYIDMRLVRGVDLETVLRRDGPLAPARAVNLVHQVAAALDAAHAETVLHRDVKPANILLSGDDFASLVDFGLASAAGEAKLTRTGKAVGTFDYVAPERLSQDPVIDRRCDVYSLACVLYELLTGKPPYAQHQDLTELINAHLSAPIPRPSQQWAGIPAGFDVVIARGMAKHPDDRYASAGEFAAAAQHALGPAAATREWTTPAPPAPAPPVSLPTQPRPTPPTHPAPVAPPAWARPRTRTRRRIVLAVAGFAVVAVIATVATVVALHRPAPTRTAATSTPRPSSTVPTTLKFPALVNARGVAVDHTGSVYATELSEHSPNGRVLKLTAGQTGAAELPLGEIYAEGVAVDTAGTVYVADFGSKSVWKLAPGARGPTPLPFGHLVRPIGVAVGRDGTVYATDGALRQVLKLAPNAASATVLIPTIPLNTPSGIAVDGDGNLFIADSEERRVLKLPVGADTPNELPFPGLQQPYGVAVDKKNNVYVTDIDGRGVFKLPAGATSATQVTFPALNYPFGVAVDEDGDLFVVDCHRGDDCATGKVLELGAAQ